VAEQLHDRAHCHAGGVHALLLSLFEWQGTALDFADQKGEVNALGGERRTCVRVAAP
jgi:hypothetical protein